MPSRRWSCAFEDNISVTSSAISLISDKVFPQLGPLYVASYLEANDIYPRVLDETGKKDWRDHIREAALNSDYIGLTATTPDFPQAIEANRIIKAANPKCVVILGGPHATVAPFTCTMFDKVVVGDGWTGIFEAFKPNTPQTIRSKMIEDFDDPPFPARHHIDMHSYHYEINGREATNVMSQLGCPYGCVFCCGRDLMEYRKMRVRSIPNVMEELDGLHDEYGYSAFMFYDDEVNILKPRTMDLCHALKERDYYWRAFVKANLFDEPLAKAMADAGCYELLTGVESGSPKVLKTIQKMTTPEINSECRRLCKKYGIRFKAATIVGLPGSTYEDEMMTKQWLIDNAPDDFDVTVNTPYPGAPEYDHREKFDLEFNINYEKDVAMYKGIPGDASSFVRTSGIPFERMKAIRDEIDRDVRKALGLPPPSLKFGEGQDLDHSMGQSSPEVMEKILSFYEPQS